MKQDIELGNKVEQELIVLWKRFRMTQVLEGAGLKVRGISDVIPKVLILPPAKYQIIRQDSSVLNF